MAEYKPNHLEIIGRQQERALLGEALVSDRAELIAIYGRRRVGKTFLVREFFRPQAKVFQVTGISTGSMTDQLAKFSVAFDQAFGKGTIQSKPPASWAEAFANLRSALGPKPRKKNRSYFLTNFPGWPRGGPAF